MAASPSALPRLYAWFAAVLNDDIELLEDLLAMGVPIDVPHPLRHSTALMEATRLGRAGMVQWLLEHGATPAFLCGLPLGTALHCALRRHHWDIASLLAHTMESCAVIDVYGATPLHVLCSEAVNIEDSAIALGLATLLLKKGCPIDAIDYEGTAALHHCVMNDLRALATLLLDHGANPNMPVPDSLVSPLMIAALDKNIGMARLLMLYGADPMLKMRDGATPVIIHPPLARLMTKEMLMVTRPPKVTPGEKAIST